MNPVLVVVETRHGHCAKIAERVARRVEAEGLEVYLEKSPGGHPIAVSRFSAAIVIAAVYDRHYPRAVADFVRSHAHALSAGPGAFLSVSLAAASKRAAPRKAIERLTHDFLAENGWRQPHLHFTGGALAYPIYTRAVRWQMRTAAWMLGLPTDTSKTHDLTSWEAIDDAVDEVLGDLAVQKAPPLRVA